MEVNPFVALLTHTKIFWHITCTVEVSDCPEGTFWSSWGDREE